jgi:hypothetical protein
VPFDVDAVVRDLRARLHPNAEFLESILTGKRNQRERSQPVFGACMGSGQLCLESVSFGGGFLGPA